MSREADALPVSPVALPLRLILFPDATRQLSSRHQAVTFLHDGTHRHLLSRISDQLRWIFKSKRGDTPAGLLSVSLRPAVSRGPKSHHPPLWTHCCYFGHVLSADNRPSADTGHRPTCSGSCREALLQRLIDRKNPLPNGRCTDTFRISCAVHAGYGLCNRTQTQKAWTKRNVDMDLVLMHSE